MQAALQPTPVALSSFARDWEMNQRVFDVPYDLETPAQNVTSGGDH